jgi:hypothetical protein
MSVSHEEQLLGLQSKGVLNVIIFIVDIIVSLFQVLPRLERFF